jgi:Ca2+:H+ antiporter
MLFTLGVSAAVAFGMTPAFVGFIVVALWGCGGDVLNVFSRARIGWTRAWAIALGSASQIALFVAPIVVLFGYVIGTVPTDLQFWSGTVVMMLFAPP